MNLSKKDYFKPEIEKIELSKEELAEFGKGLVINTLTNLGFKSTGLKPVKIYRKQMINMLGFRAYERAVNSGKLIVRQDGKRTSPKYALISDWERYLKKYVNTQH